MTVGEQCAAARRQQGLTQQAVAQQLHVARQTISNWETGRSYPDIASLLALSELYQLSLDSLLKEDAKTVEDVQKKEAERRMTKLIYYGSLAVDLIAVVILVGHQLAVPGLAMGRAASLLVSLIVLANVGVLLAATQRYKATRRVWPNSGLAIGAGLILLVALVVLLVGRNLGYALGFAIGGLAVLGVVCGVQTWLTKR